MQTLWLLLDLFIPFYFITLSDSLRKFLFLLLTDFVYQTKAREKSMTLFTRPTVREKSIFEPFFRKTLV
jgi:hypothetical protein